MPFPFLAKSCSWVKSQKCGENTNFLVLEMSRTSNIKDSFVDANPTRKERNFNYIAMFHETLTLLDVTVSYFGHIGLYIWST